MTLPRESDRYLDRAVSPSAFESTRVLLNRIGGTAYRCTLPEWNTKFVTAGSRTLLGFDPRHLTDESGPRWDELIHPGDRESVACAMMEAARLDRPYDIEYRMIRLDGTRRWVRDRGGCVRHTAWSTVVEGLLTDITERKEREDATTRRLSFYETLLEESHTGVFLLKNQCIEYANPQFLEHLGLSDDTVPKGMPFIRFVSEDDRDGVDQLLQSLDFEGEPVRRFEFRSVGAKADRIILAQLNLLQFDAGEGDGIMGSTLDVTDRRRAESRYHQAQKMESLGNLATGVAHDFNNVLAVINSASYLVSADPTNGASVLEGVRDIREAAARGASLSRQLMAFGRAPDLVAQRVEPGRVIEEVLPLLRRLLHKTAEVRYSGQDGASCVWIAPPHLEQIVMNLVLNANDATSNGGPIDVGVRRTDARPRCPTKGEGPFVEISVRDRGTGIEPQFMKRLFEPYFTTKGDRGTGLGLANVWRIATEAGGCVGVVSEVGTGSTFTVYLPVAEAVSDS